MEMQPTKFTVYTCFILGWKKRAGDEEHKVKVAGEEVMRCKQTEKKRKEIKITNVRWKA